MGHISVQFLKNNPLKSKICAFTVDKRSKNRIIFPIAGCKEGVSTSV